MRWAPYFDALVADKASHPSRAECVACATENSSRRSRDAVLPQTSASTGRHTWTIRTCCAIPPACRAGGRIRSCFDIRRDEMRRSRASFASTSARRPGAHNRRRFDSAAVCRPLPAGYQADRPRAMHWSRTGPCARPGGSPSTDAEVNSGGAFNGRAILAHGRAAGRSSLHRPPLAGRHVKCANRPIVTQGRHATGQLRRSSVCREPPLPASPSTSEILLRDRNFKRKKPLEGRTWKLRTTTASSASSSRLEAMANKTVVFPSLPPGNNARGHFTATLDQRTRDSDKHRPGWLPLPPDPRDCSLAKATPS